MANPRPVSPYPSNVVYLKLARRSFVEVYLPTPPQTGADKVYGPALSVELN